MGQQHFLRVVLLPGDVCVVIFEQAVHLLGHLNNLLRVNQPEENLVEPAHELEGRNTMLKLLTHQQAIYMLRHQCFGTFLAQWYDLFKVVCWGSDEASPKGATSSTWSPTPRSPQH